MSKFFFRVYHILLCLLAVSCPNAGAEPIPTKNHSPIFMGLLFPAFESAPIRPPGKTEFRVQMDYSNIFYFRAKKGFVAGFDLEEAELSFSAKRGFGNGLEAGIEQPFYRLGGGFLDQLILDYHSTFGFPDPAGERSAPRNRYLAVFIHNGIAWNSPAPNRFTLGDPTIWVKKRLFKNDGSTLSAKIVVQPPLASTTDGLGNGAWEFGALLLYQQKLDRLELNFDIGSISPGSIDRGEQFDLPNFTIVRAGGEYPLNNRFSLLLQSSYTTSPFIEAAWYEITFGARYLTSTGKRITFGFLEDLSQTAPDFTIHVSFSF